MRTKTLSTVFYAPEIVPQSLDETTQRYLRNEFQKLAAAINALAAGHLDTSYAAPSKPRDGDIRYADGSTWNPGSGAGIYWYNGSTWTKM